MWVDDAHKKQGSKKMNSTRSAMFLAVVMAIGTTTVAQAQQPGVQQPVPVTPPSAPDVKIETSELAPGIYLLTGRGGNIGLTVGVDGAAIIDDQFADMAPKIRAAVSMLSDQPVKFVINTHMHGDHTGGNDAFGKAGAVIIAQENVRKRLGTPQVNPVNNQPVAPRAREALPVVTFADSATLHFNDDDLEFMHLPNAHTETDIYIRFRRANIVHMGDMFTGGFPFIDGSNGGTLDGLIKAHEAVLPKIDDQTKVIRGHGPVGTKAELQAYHDMLVVVRDRVAKLVKAGKSQDDVVAARPTKEFEEKYGGANFNAAQWIGRAYVDQKGAADGKKKK
jgi:glyoxylase-like metal-dependent hydrolase (beta-lactamase superfamily II)